MPYKKLPIPRVGAKRTEKGGRPQKYILSPEGRRLILEKYDGSTERLDELERLLKPVPRWVIIKWASQMGLTRDSRNQNWTPEEIAFLKKNIKTMSMKELAEKLERAEYTIRRKAIREGLYQPHTHEGYNMQDLMLGLGVTNHHKIEQWIEDGWLKGRKRRIGVTHQEWHFTDKDIKAFILTHPDEIDPRRFDWLWIVDVLSGGIGRLDDERYAKGEE
jgi:hypothetical protein